MKQFLPPVLVCAALVGMATAQKPGEQGEHTHPAPGTSIVHFAQIDEGVYKGSKPKNDADYRFYSLRTFDTLSTEVLSLPVSPRKEESQRVMLCFEGERQHYREDVAEFLLIGSTPRLTSREQA